MKDSLIVATMMAITLVIGTTAKATDSKINFDSTPYLGADIPPLSGPVQFSPINYSAPFTMSLHVQALTHGQTQESGITVSGTMHVTFTDNTIEESLDISSLAQISKDSETTQSGTPLLIYKIAGTKSGDLNSRDFILGPELKNSLSKKEQAEFMTMMQSSFGEAEAKTEIASYSYLWRPLLPNGNLAPSTSIGSIPNTINVCGLDLSKLRLAVKGSINNAIVGRYSDKHTDDKQGCVINADATVVVDASTGQPLYGDVQIGIAANDPRKKDVAAVIFEVSIVEGRAVPPMARRAPPPPSPAVSVPAAPAAVAASPVVTNSERITPENSPIPCQMHGKWCVTPDGKVVMKIKRVDEFAHDAAETKADQSKAWGNP